MEDHHPSDCGCHIVATVSEDNAPPSEEGIDPEKSGTCPSKQPQRLERKGFDPRRHFAGRGKRGEVAGTVWDEYGIGMGGAVVLELISELPENKQYDIFW
ncbi:hypothetical protein NPIL_133721 [Nephila pilipes]|uniref:Uncharacterized protein n=1 Tax=Nephila pilipes TaxID=299642 RepID=A0A8X6UN16_NEPPI|nr:hypothetical protein NPIL_133721 [Nephila pilipes]